MDQITREEFFSLCDESEDTSTWLTRVLTNKGVLTEEEVCVEILAIHEECDSTVE